jgi:glycosyltransferase involved in cell wall biosynthesis
MKALLLSTFDNVGGASRAAFRLHQGLREIGVASNMLVQYKAGNDDAVLLRGGRLTNAARSRLDSLPLHLYSRPMRTPYSLEWLPERLASRVRSVDADVINLHWICAGFARIETLARLKQPLIWTLHDMWPFTGGCHYDQECGRYRESCGACPQLSSRKDSDLSRWVWRRKSTAWRSLNLTVVAPSQWLAQQARASSLFKDRRIEVIPYGIDLRFFKPIPRPEARSALNLPQDRKLLLFGAISPTSDPRKGFKHFEAALERLRGTDLAQEIDVVVFGGSAAATLSGFRTYNLGFLDDDAALSTAYAAADVFVAPSIQDNLPNTVMESLACGVPCVAFKIGGMPDMIEHRRNGYLAQAFDLADLAEGITWALRDSTSQAELSVRARQKAEQEFSHEKQARRYLDLFKDALQQR